MTADNKNWTDATASGSPAELDIAGLVDLLDRWGGDLAAWPDGQLAETARSLIDRDPSARAHWTEARALDGLLDTAPPASASPDLADRIMAATQDAPKPTNVVSLAGAGRQRRFRWQPMALAASLLIGLVIGAGTSPETVDTWLGGAVYAADDFEVVIVETDE
jgi:hypothetical protein